MLICKDGSVSEESLKRLAPIAEKVGEAFMLAAKAGNIELPDEVQEWIDRIPDDNESTV